MNKNIEQAKKFIKSLQEKRKNKRIEAETKNIELILDFVQLFIETYPSVSKVFLKYYSGTEKKDQKSL